MVGRVREVLCFEREAVALAVEASARPAEIADEEVARVQLHSGLRRADLQRAVAVGIDHERSLAQPGASQDEIVVVAMGDGQLLTVWKIDPAQVASERLE